MSSGGKILDQFIEQKLLNLHTAFLAKVLSVSDDNTAKIQPLNMIKANGKDGKKQSAMVDVPIMKKVEVKKGNTAVCLCIERDITETKEGKYAIPQIGHHRLSDAVIIGVI